MILFWSQSKHHEVFEQLKADGHQVGNHTFSHLKGWITEDKTYLENYLKCQQITQTNLFRPPYGRIKRSQIMLIKDSNKSKIVDQKPTIIMWDVLSGDFDMNLSPEKCLKNVLKHTENGSIVVFHDSIKAWERLEHVLPKALNYWAKQGFQFKIL